MRDFLMNDLPAIRRLEPARSPTIPPPQEEIAPDKWIEMKCQFLSAKTFRCPIKSSALEQNVARGLDLEVSKPQAANNKIQGLIKGALRVLLLTWTLFGLFGCKPAADVDQAPAPKISREEIIFPTNAPQLSYLTVEPARDSKTSVVGLYGRLAWDDGATVRVYSPLGGRILKIPVEVNQTVASGEVLALVDSPDYGQALADARTAAGNFAAALKAFTRAKELLAHGAAAQKDVESAEAAYVAANAETERAKGRLANFGGSLDATNDMFALRSPLAGVVVEKNMSLGQEIRSDLMLANAPQFTTPQFVVTDPARLWLLLDVDETTATTLTTGRDLVIHTKAYPEKVFHGRLEIIGQELDPTTRTVKTRCRVDNSDKLLRAEMYVTADIANGGDSVVNVPTRAVFLKNNDQFVFLEIAPGHFERRMVKTGPESGGKTAILEGIQPGQRVVTDGCLLLESMIEGTDL
jgi:cobalt-zinc-cadmium efflux system membrane fusion protein